MRLIRRSTRRRHVISRRSIEFTSVRMRMEVLIRSIRGGSRRVSGNFGGSTVSWRVVWGWRPDVRKGKVGRFTSSEIMHPYWQHGVAEIAGYEVLEIL